MGLNYFSGHRFRSRVFLDIGEPFAVPRELAKLYATGGENKHEATARLMELVESALATVTISAPDYETLEFFWTLRRLTSNDQREPGGPMSLERQVAFVRKFGRGYESKMADGTPLKDSARVQRIRALCSAYNERLKEMGIRDYQVAHVLSDVSKRRALALLLSRTALLLLYVVCLVPAVLFLPLLVCTRSIAAIKAAQAVKSSSVKLKGRDVLSTWKIIVSMGLFPALYLLYTALAFSLAGEYLPPPWSLEAGLLFFFLFPFVAYGAIKGGENVVRTARSLLPLLMSILRPNYAHTLVEARARAPSTTSRDLPLRCPASRRISPHLAAPHRTSSHLIACAQERTALKEAMQGLVDEQGWVLAGGDTPPQPLGAARAEPRRVSAQLLETPEHRILEEARRRGARPPPRPQPSPPAPSTLWRRCTARRRRRPRSRRPTGGSSASSRASPRRRSCSSATAGCSTPWRSARPRRPPRPPSPRAPTPRTSRRCWRIRMRRLAGRRRWPRDSYSFQ